MTEAAIPEENAIIAHARQELDLLVEEDPEFKNSLLEAVRGFTSYGHSGGSAGIAIHMLDDLLNARNLSPLTNDPEEWMEVEMKPDHSCWQSRRCADAFTYDPEFNKYYRLAEQGALSFEEFTLQDSQILGNLSRTVRKVSEGSNG